MGVDLGVELGTTPPAAAEATTAKHAAGTDGKKGFRPDIQGLRAFAVIVVVLDHVFGWPSGGFIGVDVFFVVSGFLITGLLLREFERTGRISFSGFYRRRIKRILPAATLVLAATVAGAYVVFGQARFTSTLVDAIWSLLFAANWRFADVGTDYFQAAGPVSPLQHYWTLAVEEQFYFVWPWLMLLVFVLFLRGRRSGSDSGARIAAGAAIVVLSSASFGWAMWQTAESPTLAYFSTFTRGWELGIGAAIAVVAPWLTGLPARLRPVLAWAGLTGMTASLFLISPASPFPGPGAVLPTVGTALVIAAGCGAADHRTLGVLTNPVSQYLGNISYSMYLWHWPIIVFGGVLIAGTGILDYALLIGAIVLASVYSFHLVEDPIRRSNWLSGKPGSTRPAPTYREKTLMAWVSLLGVVIVAVAAIQVAPRIFPDPERATSPSNERIAESSDLAATVDIDRDFLVLDVGPETTRLQWEIAAAVEATAWPDLDPTMDEAISTGDTSEEILPCGLIVPYDEAACTFGDPAAEHTAVLVGDSTSMTYVQALHAALGDDNGWQVRSYATFGCSFMEPLIWNSDPNVVENCTDRKDRAVEAINELRPDLVFITNTYDPRVPVGEDVALTPQEWEDSMAAIVARFEDSAGKVVFLAPPPNDLNVAACYTKVAVPADCISHVTDQWATYAEADARVAAELGAWYVSSEPWFCVDSDCPSFVGTVPTKSDHVHMLPAYAEKIAPAILEELEGQGIL